jgi:hypothetical protein
VVKNENIELLRNSVINNNYNLPVPNTSPKLTNPLPTMTDRMRCTKCHCEPVTIKDTTFCHWCLPANLTEQTCLGCRASFATEYKGKRPMCNNCRAGCVQPKPIPVYVQLHECDGCRGCQFTSVVHVTYQYLGSQLSADLCPTCVAILKKGGNPFLYDQW